MLPNLDPKIKKVLDLKGSEEDFLTTPVRWIDDERGELIAVGVGSVDGHPRKETTALLHTRARLTLTRSATQQRVPQAGGNQTPPVPISNSLLPPTQTNSVTNLSRQTTQPDSLAPTPVNESKAFPNHAPQAPLVMSDLASKPSQKVDSPPTSSAPHDFAPLQADQEPAAAAAHAYAIVPPTDRSMPPPPDSAHGSNLVPMANGTALPNHTLTPNPSNQPAPKSNSIPQLPPSNIDMSAKTEPPPMTRTQTEYMTPMGDPSEASKQLF